jgi:hypothetical protein
MGIKTGNARRLGMHHPDCQNQRSMLVNIGKISGMKSM